MNSRFLASLGGRLANVSLTLAFLLAAFVCTPHDPGTVVRATAAGIVVLIVGFVSATIASIPEFRGHSLAITVFVPLTAFLYILGLEFLVNIGSGVGAALAAVGAFVFLTGTVLGLRTTPASEGQRAGALGAPIGT